MNRPRPLRLMASGSVSLRELEQGEAVGLPPNTTPLDMAGGGVARVERGAADRWSSEESEIHS